VWRFPLHIVNAREKQIGFGIVQAIQGIGNGFFGQAVRIRGFPFGQHPVKLLSQGRLQGGQVMLVHQFGNLGNGNRLFVVEDSLQGIQGRFSGRTELIPNRAHAGLQRF
jgi:hypothetical protein